jgi:hypothetical protein
MISSPINIGPAPPTSSSFKESGIIGSLTSFASAVVHGLPGSHVSTHDGAISVDHRSASPTTATFSTSVQTESPTPPISRTSTPISIPGKEKEKKSTALELIIRKDLLDDSNAAKDLMDEVKKRLKILLRPGEPERRPQLTWPKNLKKEPVEVVAVCISLELTVLSTHSPKQEVIELLSGFREVMRHSYETMDTDKIQQRWCCGDEPWLFRERWEKLFEDFCDVKQEKFDPSRVGYLISTGFCYCADTRPGIRALRYSEVLRIASSELPLYRVWREAGFRTI